MTPTLSWVQVAFTLIGGAICLPTIFVGFLIGQRTPLEYGLLAIGAGNLILALLGLSIARLASQRRVNAPDLFQQMLGKTSGRLTSLLLGAMLAIWFGIQSQTMAEGIISLIMSREGVSPSHIKFGAFFISIAIIFSSRRIESISRICQYAVPAMLLMVAFPLFYGSASETSLHIAQDTAMSGAIEAITLVIAASIAAVVDLPTFLITCRSYSDMKKAILALFGIGTTVMETMGLLLAQSGESSLIRALTIPQEALLPYTSLASIISPLLTASFLLLAGWTTNAANLFSMVQTIISISPRRFKHIGFLVGGCLACMMSLVTLLQNLSFLLGVLSIPLIAMVGVSASISSLPKMACAEKKAGVSVFLGSIIGALGLFLGSPILFEPLVDSFFMTYLISTLLHKRRIIQEYA